MTDNDKPISDKPARDKHYPCPECRKPMLRREGKKGPFWGCSDFPKCRATLNDLHGKPSTEINEDYRCPLCTRQMVKAEADKGEYWFCSGYSKGCKVRLADHNGAPEPAFRCRKCGNLLTKRKGKHGEFWGCRSYPECKATYHDSEGHPDF